MSDPNRTLEIFDARERLMHGPKRPACCPLPKPQPWRKPWKTPPRLAPSPTAQERET
jgi:hypothetical protein